MERCVQLLLKKLALILIALDFPSIQMREFQFCLILRIGKLLHLQLQLSKMESGLIPQSEVLSVARTMKWITIQVGELVSMLTSE